MPSSIESCKLCANYFAGACGGLSGLGAGLIVYVVNTDKHTLSIRSWCWFNCLCS